MRFRNFLMVALLAFAGFGAQLSAQKIASVDMEKILTSITEYQEAQDQLDQLAAKWQQEINQEYDAIKGLYNKYQAEQVLMTDEQRQAEEQAIFDRETKVRNMQADRFGPEGSLFQRRQELIQPIQDAIYEAIETYANQNNYDFIFDRAGSAGIIFSSEQYDKTDEILRTLKN
ncbi:periplasmic chaperone for outer membrane proteins Skp [Neolewinella xylanilytica]|uniref:Periplasmic chaperone for outer membrane proteins Skp n=1 Tax=Neolewinella xylanilytica TaxID=1514080 RepID=A0A2S6IA82_9BACT|nr:OmpH family outer membrane protein [Neolewinella xylanilytica]PPK88405.1 periplasmic chaperone for outer membrane proteins Skp [Neolewinella xylanilytica]